MHSSLVRNPRKYDKIKSSILLLMRADQKSFGWADFAAKFAGGGLIWSIGGVCSG
jgi:hypothetical protein